ncbi:PrsW family intramembrane metalloprotease [Nostoc sp. 'Peltigera membranacea cyanobiont' 210A]|uniref:PrsW family intramembrane metalloprotease n=1 Tax=Nostoc sp. 'Peltigera membranacea cyanobiont' 210A TaxID=2014529 RepID=UPI000B95B747|nr:PrsW family glutamic-type intramembrane protease [Nostoc sp. 'Peltigera membranacea cyanobiont' 210A]OYD91126.1 PrsW family intramembrane metalloprotease [Nostoc sp. 'Peltigera membranacea cyanobiont' 210A]
MVDLSLVLWALIPPLLLLGYYYCRVPFAPPLLKLLMFFIIGAISGILALSLEWVFETVANYFVDWQQFKRWLPGIALRQLVEVGTIEEGCKLAAVVVPTYYLQRKYRLLHSTVFLFTIAVALGFTAEENWIYLFHDTASILDRTIGTPVHAMFSAPWGYALGTYISSNTRLNRDKKFIFRAWLNSVICHALVNVLSSAWRYSLPLHFLSYGLFPFLLWMFWRLEQLLRKVQGKPVITLISDRTIQRRYWQRSLVLFALVLSGNAIFGLFLLVRKISPLSPSKLFDTYILWFIFSRFLLNLFFGVLAWGIYRYLRHSARRRYF